jgi:hypothetical protein
MLDLIDEIRESRLRMSEECKHDLTRYIEYMKSFNAKYSNQVELFRRAHKSFHIRDTAASSSAPAIA